MKPEREQEYLTLLKALVAVSKAAKGTPATDDERVLDAEGLLLKFFFHACSALYLSHSTTVDEVGASFFDCASTQVVCRAALESFLVFEYVFTLPTSKDERDFRYWSWVYAGLLERQAFPVTLPESKQKLAAERALIDAFRSKIEASPCFQALKKGEQKKILKGTWRLHSWTSIARSAGLSEMNAKHVYSYLCSYAHASSLSVMQVRQARTADEQQRLMAPMLEVLMSAMAFMVKAYTALLPNTERALTPAQKCVVKKWYGIGSST